MVEDGLKMSDKEREALDEIAALADMRPRISEELFVSRYLPILGSRQPNTDITPWLEVAGNAYRAVDVVKDGNVLFTVPPIFRQIPTKIHRRGSESVLEIVETSKLHAAQHPRVGQHYLDQHLSSSVERVDPETEQLEKWKEVLKRYGYDTQDQPTALGAESAVAGNEPANSRDIFDGGFEEL